MADWLRCQSLFPWFTMGPSLGVPSSGDKLHMARLNSVGIFVTAAETKFDGTEFCTCDFSEPAELHTIFCGFMGHESEYFQ